MQTLPTGFHQTGTGNVCDEDCVAGDAFDDEVGAFILSKDTGATYLQANSPHRSRSTRRRCLVTRCRQRGGGVMQRHDHACAKVKIPPGGSNIRRCPVERHSVSVDTVSTLETCFVYV